LNGTDTRLWHPWLRINGLLRAMPREHWGRGGLAAGQGRVRKGARAQEWDPAGGLVQL